MPPKKNKAMRILVPLAIIVGGIAVAAAVFVNAGNNPPTSTKPIGQAAPTETPAETPAEEPVADQPATTEPVTAAPAPVTEPSATKAEVVGLHPVLADEIPTFDPIGNLVPKSDQAMRIDFSNYGAGIATIRLNGIFNTVEQLHSASADPTNIADDTHVELQAQFLEPLTDGSVRVAAPFMVLGVEINGTFVDLSGYDSGRVWTQTAPGQFVATIVDEGGNEVLRIERAFRLRPGAFDFVLDQSVTNLTDGSLEIKWLQLASGELARDATGYGGDKRRVRFGYLLPELASQPGRREFVLSEEFLLSRQKTLGKRDSLKQYKPERELWPNKTSTNDGLDLVWTGTTSRYFGVAVHPLVDPDDAAADKQFNDVNRVDRLLFNRTTGEGMVLRLTGQPFTLQPGSTRDLSQGIYAGPLSEKEMGPEARAVGLGGLVVYNFGGPCSFCTFTALTGLLFWLLSNLHAHVVHDWALAIIVLVLIVRTCLHPVTKWSQVKMLRFGKQMQNMGPKMAKVKERYGDDPKKQQAEIGKLWKEEGISPAGFLGCLPMFLQTPVWIALYATLFFAIELRHEAAFFGVFQQIGGWPFLGDLASPDSAIPLPKTFHVPIISKLMGPISSINLLPFLLGVVFYLHQKYMTPQTSSAMTPEQQQQQKMIRVMTVVMFPVIMYNAPSGLALYFITNSTLGIVESRWIRKNAEAKGELESKKPTKPKRPGFIQRMQQLAAEQQKLREQGGKRGGKQNAPGTGKSKQARAGKSYGPDPTKRFKKR